MLNQYLIIRLDNTKIDLTTKISLTYNKTNLPKEAFKFKTYQPLFWKLEQKHYDSESETLTVNVVDYNSTSNTVILEQEPKYPIKNLKFEKLDWKKFEPLIYSYILSNLRNNIFNYPERLHNSNNKKNKGFNSDKLTNPALLSSTDTPVKEIKEIEIKVKYEDARFDVSKISFSIHLKPYNFEKQLEIINPIIRPEFEYIKPYFVKRLGKSFLAKIKLILLDNKIEEISALSDDINNINETVVNSIKVFSVLNLKHFINEQKDKIIYDTKELSAEEPSLTGISVEDILEIFIKNDKVKNVKQLEFLARNKQNLNERVQFTIKPLFGFLFREFEKKQCFIWELLNSHATYVWKNTGIESSLDLGKVVELSIASIKSDGREAYKKYYKSIENPDYYFGVIEHPSNDLTDDERFTVWRKNLEKFCS